MTDRELLELAAKAAGIPLVWHNFSNIPTLFKGLSSDEVWNPLTDDGDALRLAVKLGMTVNIENDIKAVCATAGWKDGHLLPDGVDTELLEGDPYAATRRAIVRAAAEIGKSMP